MIEIIATAAVSALASSAVFHRVYSDKVRRLRNSNACRDRKLSEAATLEKQLRGWLAERDFHIDKLFADLERAGKPDQPRDPVTGRWLAKQSKSAAKPAPDDGWIQWYGDGSPGGDPEAIVEVKLRNGKYRAPSALKSWRWDHFNECDIIAYRIVSAEQREAA